MFCVYKLNHPFFEQYKSSYDKWPWDKDRKDWNQRLKNSIKILSFNALVIITIAKVLTLVLKKWKETESLEFSTLPTASTLIY